MRHAGLVAALVMLGSPAPQHAKAVGDTRTITLHHIHTGQDITITYKRDGRYDEDALKKLNVFVRDWRKNEEIKMDPRLFDYMWEIQHAVGHKGPINIICGYRSPATNAMLRRRSRGVARTSLHMAGKAMDFTLPGADIAAVRAAALRIQGGGVGYYPTSGVPFVHVDVGNVRHWPRMTREQLARVFPDGRTLHVPSDGHPLPGYQLALADHERDTANRLSGTRSRNLFASLFSRKTQDEDEDTSDATPTRAPAAQPARRGGKTEVVAAEPETKAAAVPLPPKRPAVQVASAESKPAPKPSTFQVASAESKPAPMPPRQPMFEIASAESRPAPMPTRPKLLDSPAWSASQVIGERGYWEGLPEFNVSAARRVADSQAFGAGATEPTGSVGPFQNAGRAPVSGVMAYAPQNHQPSAVQPNAMKRSFASVAPAIVSTKADATVAAMPAKPTKRSAAEFVRAIPNGERLNDPWMRGVMLAPSMQTSMTATVLGELDLSMLTAFMQKPASSVMMTFSADPYLGMTTSRFSGSAIVFQATVTHSMRTAALR